MNSNNEVPFSSFLAGALIVKGSISNLELSSLMAKFEYENNISFCEDDYDYNFKFINNLFNMDENGFELNSKYDAIIIINNEMYCVYDYLYSFTDEMVRCFFNIPEKNFSESKHLKNKKLN